jgi:hypothetical protein
VETTTAILTKTLGGGRRDGYCIRSNDTVTLPANALVLPFGNTTIRHLQPRASRGSESNFVPGIQLILERKPQHKKSSRVSPLSQSESVSFVPVGDAPLFAMCTRTTPRLGDDFAFWSLVALFGVFLFVSSSVSLLRFAACLLSSFPTVVYRRPSCPRGVF